MLLRRLTLAAAALVAWAGPMQALAQDLQPVPALSARVIDQTATLSTAQTQALVAKLAAFEAASGPQIVVLLVRGTAPEDIAAYAQRVADSWQIGRREVGDGVLLLVAKDERRVRIEVAKALEGAIPDLAARQIIDNALRPAFRADDYAGGLNQAVDQLMQRIRGEGLPAPAPQARGRDASSLENLVIVLLMAVPIAGAVFRSLFGRKLGTLLAAGGAAGVAWWITASLLASAAAGLAALALVGLLGVGSALRRIGGQGGLPSIGGWSGGGGGSWGGGSGGGGFSSGGGGDFGGGGASGNW